MPDMNQPGLPESLFSDLTRLIGEARTRAAVTVNAEESIVFALRRQLSWTHIRTIIRPLSVQCNF